MKKHQAGAFVSGKTDSAAILTPADYSYLSLTRLDWIIPPVVSFFAALWLYFHIYSAINWDDLLYMNLATHTEGQNWILNRYGHIYILKLFYALTGGAILGTRIYWCFFFIATATLIYWTAKLLAGKKGALIAAAAVLLVFTEPLFGREAGSPLADFSVMFFAALATFLYLAFLGRRPKYSCLLIMLLGLIFFWAVKCKEIGIYIGVLFLGLGRDSSNNWHFVRHLKDIGWALCGALVGCLLLMCLDAVFIGDFWFSVRPSNIQQVFGTNIGTPVFEPGEWTTESWFAFFTTRSFFVIFILYIIAGFVSPIKDLSPREKLIWAAPLFLILFLTFSRRCFYVVPRYISPALPIMAAFGAQLFKFDFTDALKPAAGSQTISRKLTAAVLIFIAFVIIQFTLVPRIDSLVEFYKIDTSKVVSFPNLRYDKLTDSQLLYMLTIMPLALSILLTALVMTKKRGLPTVFIVSICFFALILPPFKDSVSLVNSSYERSKWRFEPCRVFSSDFKFTDKTRIFIYQDMQKYIWLFGRDLESHRDIFNVYFNARLSVSQFTLGGPQNILKGDYDYAILAADEQISQLSGKPEFKKLMEKFELKQADAIYPGNQGKMPLVLLKKR
jgi:hypothetical protein